jgi:hypothetical protein
MPRALQFQRGSGSFGCGGLGTFAFRRLGFVCARGLDCKACRVSGSFGRGEARVRSDAMRQGFRRRGPIGA